VDWLEATGLGLLQGLTEFLPVSSSGHLVLAEAALGVHDPGIFFEVALHAATLVAVVVFYRRRILELVIGAAQGERAAFEYIAKLALATIPAVAFALLARNWIEQQFEAPLTAGLGLLATGGLLWTTRTTLPRAERPGVAWSDAWWIGCAQAFAILPGVSRSGTTVCVALWLGVRALPAAEFSFLMSVVAIAGAVVLQLQGGGLAAGGEVGPIAVAAVAALLSGLAALALFIRLLRGQSFARFAFYVWALGALAIAWATLGFQDRL